MRYDSCEVPTAVRCMYEGTHGSWPGGDVSRKVSALPLSDMADGLLGGQGADGAEANELVVVSPSCLCVVGAWL